MGDDSDWTNEELNIHTNIKMYKNAIEVVRKRIIDLQNVCEHKHEEQDPGRDIFGNSFGKICLVCEKWTRI